MTKNLGSTAFAAPLLLASIACAEVTDLADNHLAIRHQELVAAPPAKVYQTLLAIGSWCAGRQAVVSGRRTAAVPMNGLRRPTGSMEEVPGHF